MIYHLSVTSIRSVVALHNYNFGEIVTSNDDDARAYASERSPGHWDVKLPLDGHPAPVLHPISHPSRQAAEDWIQSEAGRRWIDGMVRWNTERLVR